MNSTPRVLALAVGLLSGAAVADNLGGADKLLCSVLQTTACRPDSDCAPLSPSELNIPQFIRVDVAGKRLSTTPASGENRSTAVQTVRREEGRIILQGYDQGRAFSLVIDEATGHASFASAAVDRVVAVFAACTPMP